MHNTALYAALVSGHESVARAISEAMDGSRSRRMNAGRGLTALHVSRLYALPESMHCFLSPESAGVNIRDAFGNTPIRHALLAGDRWQDYAVDAVRTRDPDAVFKTVWRLIRAGANLDARRDGHDASWQITPRMLGAGHPNLRIKEWFREDYPPPPSPPRRGIQIGRG
jgi:hypothetical protein